MKNVNRLHNEPIMMPEAAIPSSKMVPQSPVNPEELTDQSLGVELTARRLNVLDALRSQGCSHKTKRPRVGQVVGQPLLTTGGTVDLMAASERVLGIGVEENGFKRGSIENPLLNDPVFAAAVEKSRQVEKELSAHAHLLSHSETDDELDDDSNGGESACSSAKIDPKFLRTYAESCPLPWNTFLRLRRSWGQSVKLSEAQEESIFRAVEKIPQGVGSIHDSLPFVTAFIEKHCPELKASRTPTEPRPGTTLLLLSVITGNTKLCYECLKLGANPNNCAFLTDTEAPDNRLRHGYSPMFMACICEQLEIMTMLRQHGGSIHVTDRWGRTPLHAAAAMGSKEVVEWLVREGAPRKVVDIDLQKPGEVCEGKVIPSLTTTSVLFRSSQDTECHCNNKKKAGRCGCIDDMVDCWYRDRLMSSWSKTFQSVRDDLNMLSLGSVHPAQMVLQGQPKHQNRVGYQQAGAV